eukprot:750129-Pyramimonas_sp.AAC.1
MAARTGASDRANPSLGVAGFEEVARGGNWPVLSARVAALSATPSPAGLATEGGAVLCSGGAICSRGCTPCAVSARLSLAPPLRLVHVCDVTEVGSPGLAGVASGPGPVA